jgi:uncharacterized protein (TIGR01370 family)
LGGAKSLRDKMVDYVIAISKYAKSQKPGFAIIVKNGELLGHIPQYVAAIDGLITDGLVYSSSSNGISGSRTNLTTMTKRMNDLNQVKMADKPVYVVEYVSGSAWTTAKNLLKTNGYIGYSSPSKIPTTIRESTW